MNVNEECLLQFLNNPDRLYTITKQLSKYMFLKNKNNSSGEHMQNTTDFNLIYPSKEPAVVNAE